MKTVNQLNEDLSKVIDGLLDGSMQPKVAAEISNAAGKIMKGHLGQLQHMELKVKNPKVKSLEFFETPAAENV